MRTETLLERYKSAVNAGAIDIDDDGGVRVDGPSINDRSLADDLVAKLPATILASGHEAILTALGGLNSPR